MEDLNSRLPVHCPKSKSMTTKPCKLLRSSELMKTELNLIKIKYSLSNSTLIAQISFTQAHGTPLSNFGTSGIKKRLCVFVARRLVATLLIWTLINTHSSLEALLVQSAKAFKSGISGTYRLPCKKFTGTLHLLGRP